MDTSRWASGWGGWEDTQESLELQAGPHGLPLLCAAGTPEPVGPAWPGEPPPSKLRRSELRRLPAAPPVWPPAGASCPTPQPQPQRGQPGDRALTWASGHTGQIRTKAGATGSSWLGPAAPSIPSHWPAQKEPRRTPPKVSLPLPPLGALAACPCCSGLEALLSRDAWCSGCGRRGRCSRHRGENSRIVCPPHESGSLWPAGGATAQARRASGVSAQGAVCLCTWAVRTESQTSGRPLSLHDLGQVI